MDHEQDTGDDLPFNFVDSQLSPRFLTAMLYTKKPPTRCTIISTTLVQFFADIETFFLTLLCLSTDSLFRMFPDHQHYWPYLTHRHPFNVGTGDFISLNFLINTPTFASIEMLNAIKENALGLGSRRRGWICNLVPAHFRMNFYGAFLITLLRVWVFTAGSRYLLYHYCLRERRRDKLMALGLLLCLAL
ncbi:hypothetical protein PspLS_05664 [Pyricularia sp. CBS 133598]|nr:hypothetical protein PspLS_05664 [Pyricularia sp. CBS 133598]